MSNHLIQPIEIDGTLYCPIHQGGRMTSGILTSSIIVGTNYADAGDPDSPWSLVILDGYDLGGDGEISFGVTCAESVAIEFSVTDTSTTPDFYVLIDVYVDLVLVDSVSILSTDDEELVLSIADSPCGNIITLIAYASRGLDAEASDGSLTVTAEVFSVL